MPLLDQGNSTAYYQPVRDYVDGYAKAPEIWQARSLANSLNELAEWHYDTGNGPEGSRYAARLERYTAKTAQKLDSLIAHLVTLSLWHIGNQFQRDYFHQISKEARETLLNISNEIDMKSLFNQSLHSEVYSIQYMTTQHTEELLLLDNKDQYTDIIKWTFKTPLALPLHFDYKASFINNITELRQKINQNNKLVPVADRVAWMSDWMTDEPAGALYYSMYERALKAETHKRFANNIHHALCIYEETGSFPSSLDEFAVGDNQLMAHDQTPMTWEFHQDTWTLTAPFAEDPLIWHAPPVSTEPIVHSE